MGSFNVQCVASKINITHYDEVVVFPLLKINKDQNITLNFNLKDELESMNESRRDYLKNYGGELFNPPKEEYKIKVPKIEAAHLYPSEEWQVGLPIIAKYNDYGGFELESQHTHQFSVRLLINHIKKNAVEISKDNYQYAHLHFKPRELKSEIAFIHEDIKKILEVQQNSLLFLADGFAMPGSKYFSSHYSQATFTYMDKRVYDLILSEMKSARNDLYKQIEEHIEFTLPFIKAERAYFDCESGSPEAKEKMKIMHDLDRKAKLSNINSSYDNSLKCFYPDSYFDFKEHMTFNKDTKEYSWDEKRKDAYIQLLKSKADLVLVNDYMNYYLHESWTPVKYTGQEISNKNRIKFNSAVNKIAKEKYEQEFGEETPRRKKSKP